MFSKRLIGLTLLAAPVLFTNACSSTDNPLCCTEFKVGGEITSSIGGSADSIVAVQAVADLTATASAAIDDITAACRNIATDLDSSAADLQGAEAKTDKRDRMNAYCSLAVSAIGTFKASAGGSLSVVIEPVKCEASIKAKADCSAKCTGGASCDIKATPPTCKGGKLTIKCEGECKAKAGASLTCTGKCTGNCSGSCQAQGGVRCAGKCDGTCAASGQAGETGIQADGTCKGTCTGTCSVTPPGVQCMGTCSGTCDASCTGTAQASVQCDGDCPGANYEPISCSGGTLEGGCKVEAKCSANCDASVQAKATCTPPSIAVAFTGSANADAAGKLEATLKANLGVLATFKTRLGLVVQTTGTLTGNIGAVTDIKVACIPPVVDAIGQAVQDLGASASASANIVGTVSQ